jgi:DNA (cytosine-5)-methyltransferase 1
LEDLNDLLSKGYLKKYKIDTYNEWIYDIKCGRLSFPITKFLDPEKPCLTLVATDASHLGVVDGENIRRLTVRECMRLNGFPENFVIDTTYSKALDLLGNTVVVPVIKQIALRILKSLKERMDTNV